MPRWSSLQVALARTPLTLTLLLLLVLLRYLAVLHMPVATDDVDYYEWLAAAARAPAAASDPPMAQWVRWFAAGPEQFWAARAVVACLSVVGDVLLFRSLLRSLSWKVGHWFLLLQTVSTGMAHTAVALLPLAIGSSAVAVATAHVLAMFVRPTGEAITHRRFHATAALVAFVVGGVAGWPPAAALATPFAVYIVVVAVGEKYRGWTVRELARTAAVVAVVAGVVAGSAQLFPFHGGLHFVSLGGREPWWYYLSSLFLDFSAIAVLALLGVVVNVLLTAMFRLSNRHTNVLNMALTYPLLLWFAVFSCRSCKTHRAMYPVYPLVLATASQAVAQLVAIALGLVRGPIFVKRFVHHAVVGVVAVAVAALSISHTTALVERGLALVEVYGHVENGTVCVGREWRHYPSSFFLGSGAQLAVTEAEASIGSTPVVDVSACDYYVDSTAPGGSVVWSDGAAVSTAPEWTPLHCTAYNTRQWQLPGQPPQSLLCVLGRTIR